MTFQPEVFPTKFSGSSSDLLKAEMWTKRFHMAVKFSKMDADDSLDLFKLWLNDDEAKWQNDTELEEDVSEWKLENWTKALEDKFGDKKKQKGNVFLLNKMEKKVDETLEYFNKRFTNYLKTIEPEMYTEELVKKAYIDIMKKIDENVWWQLAQRKKLGTIKSLMEEADRLMIIKLQGKESAVLDKQVLGIVDTANDKYSIKNLETASDLDNKYLVQVIEKLVLLSKNNKKPKDRNNYTCYSCGVKGHTSRCCPNNAKNDTGSPDKSMVALTLDSDEARVPVLSVER
ncbi:hypothetical protein AYI69_g8266, partial [Smittium culicis]